MTGVQESNRKWEEKTVAIVHNSGIKCLNDFYFYILLNHEYSTTFQYVYHVFTFMKTISKSNPKDITLNDYINYFASIKETTKSHQNGVYSALKSFSKFVNINHLGEDYMFYIDRPKQKESAETIEKRENDFMTPDEIKEYLCKVKFSNKSDVWKQRDYTMIKILATCGIRRAALQKLDVNDINFETGTMKVTEKGAKVRFIYLSDDLVEDIRKWINYRKTLMLSTSALFVSNRKNRLNLATVNAIVSLYNPCVHPHEFRSSYATNLYDVKEDVYFVQQCMGHNSPGMTERYIRGKKDVASRKAADIMNDMYK